MRQTTLSRTYEFEGKGLHTGEHVRVSLCPAPEWHGIVFCRRDISPFERIQALASNVTDTSRSTCLGNGRVSVRTVEHLLSALAGMGVDNALVNVWGGEVPILDGSALPYARAIKADALKELDAPRKYIELPDTVEVSDPRSGSFVRLEPADEPSFEVTVDYGSRVLGVQKAFWDPSVDYAAQIAPSRTFVFFHELEYLHSPGLIHGGDVDNAIVVVERPVGRESIDRIAALFGQEGVDVTPEGYLSNLTLRFPNECGRHKLLDLIGDISLAGGLPRAKVTACKSGHSINTRAVAAVLRLIGNN